ncbi:MAG: hypothetical protein EXS69_01970 [Candidatus Zambryskibacteria bacterium]|nr:hypothetical protein [Candidatus Zambryskibacteria bacterium]
MEEPKPVAPNSFLKQIRTFQGDVASALEHQRESLYSIQETERLKRASGGTITDTDSSIPSNDKRKEFFLLLVGSFLLICVGLAGAWLAYNEFLRKTAPPVLAIPGNRFITPQSVADIDLTGASRETAFSLIARESADLAQTDLKHLILRKSVGTETPLITASEFFGLLQSSAPSSLVRSFEPLFMLGSLGQGRFLIFKLASFENAFAGQLAWEKSMAEDIGPLFTNVALLKNIGPEYTFKDIVSKNKDARALFAPISPGSATTTPVLLYSFFNSKMLIITNSIETLKTLMDRLTQESLSR